MKIFGNYTKIKKWAVRVISFLSSCFMSFVISDFLTTLYAKLYALNEGVPLKELSEDYGMGIAVSLLFLFSFLLLLPTLYFLIKKQIDKVIFHD